MATQAEKLKDLYRRVAYSEIYIPVELWTALERAIKQAEKKEKK